MTALMLIISAIIMQLPSDKKKQQGREEIRECDVMQRVHSLACTGDIHAVAQGLSRHFRGSLDMAIQQFLQNEDTPFSASEKEDVLFAMIRMLRSCPDDQYVVCSRTLEYHSNVSSDPLLYVVAQGANPDVVKDIVRCVETRSVDGASDLIYQAYDYAITRNTIAPLETLCLHQIMPDTVQASSLLKRVVSEKKGSLLAQFFIQRVGADFSGDSFDMHQATTLAMK